MFQTTLRDALDFSGVGIHTGLPGRVRIVPAPPGSGRLFRLSGGVVVPATAEYVVETRRATVIGIGDARLSTVEHLLSALCGMGVDNVTIEAEGPEVPILDGSAKIFADAIAAVGTVAQPEPAMRFRAGAPTFFRDGDKTVTVLPAKSWRIDMTVDYPAPIGAQFFEGEITPEFYREQIAPARTFGYRHEVEALLRSGLARGGSLENALVFDVDGPMTPLRWPNEPVRHKVLDLIGDFALLGMRPQAQIVALKSGHKLHAEAVRELRRDAAARRTGGTTAYEA